MTPLRGSVCFVWIQIRMHVVKYDWHMPIVNCFIEYIVYVQNSVVSGSGQHNLNCFWRK